MKRKWMRLSALGIGLALVGAACGGDDGDASSDTTAGGATTTGAEGSSTTAAAGGSKAGALSGLKGTTPLVELSGDFKSRLLAIDPALKDYNYAAETYDAVTIIALAVTKANTDGIDYAKEINGITRTGQKCTDFKSCLVILQAGGDVDYDGMSGPIEFSGNGEPLQASYGILEFGDNNRLDDAKTTYKQAKAPASADVPAVAVEGTRAGDGELKIGTILPQTGSLAFLGPPEFAGFDLALQDINAAGGVLGKSVVGSKGDSGDATTDTVNQTVDRLLAENVDAIIGAASSGVSLKVIDKIAGAGVVQFSPANTSKAFSTYNDKGLYFRTAPSDILQGAVLGELIAGDGHRNVAIIARNDSYGTGLAEDLEAALSQAGGKVVVKKIYDEKADKFNSEVNEIKAASPDAVALIGFDESSKILATMVETQIGPSAMPIYGCDGNMGNALGENFDAGK
jgi:ABC-type branched-subunit amino acid transport system substrate-binding protein